MTKVVALDLEMNQPSGKIIQIGAAVGCTNKQVVLDRFEALVNPGEPLNPFIEQLTGITQARMDAGGISLRDAADKLFAFIAPHQTFMNPVTWGTGDVTTLREQLGMQDERWPFGRRWLDLKTIHVTMCLTRGLSPKGGLAVTMKKHYGLEFEGAAHDAGFDAANTLRLFFEMQKRYFSER